MWNTTAELLEQTNKILPSSERCGLIVGLWYAVGQMDRAAHCYAECSGELASSRYQPVRHGAIPLISASRLAFESGDLYSAMQQAQRAMVQEPERLNPAVYKHYYQTIANWAAFLAQSGDRELNWNQVCGKYAYRTGDFTSAQIALESAIQGAAKGESGRAQALARYYLGLTLSALGESKEAAAEFYQASQLAEDFWFGCVQANRLTGGQFACSVPPSARRTQLKVTPNDPEAFERWTRWPEYVTVLDYDDLRWGGHTLVAIWWRKEQLDCGKTRLAFYETAAYCVQVTDVINLVPNPGFEWVAIGQPPLLGFAQDMYQPSLSGEQNNDFRRVEQLTATPLGLSRVGVLQNGLGISRSSFVTRLLRVDRGQRYILAGWIDSEQGGNAALGCWWRKGETVPSIAQSVFNLPWQEYAGVLVPLKGSGECKLWLLNYDSLGRVLFDNILFAVLPEVTE